MKTKAIVLINPNNPTGAVYPKEILEESLRYLDVKPRYTDEEAQVLVQEEVIVPEVRGMTVKEASTMLSENRLNHLTGVEFTGEGNDIVVDIFPKPGAKVPEKSMIMLYTRNNEALPSSVVVPDLKGKTIYSTGYGTTPQYTLNYLLSLYGLDPDKDLNIEYKTEATEVAALLENSHDAIAMLPQPFVTTVMMKNENVRIALDIDKEWNKQNNNGGVVTGVVVVNKDFLEKNPEAVDLFLREYNINNLRTISGMSVSICLFN